MTETNDRKSLLFAKHNDSFLFTFIRMNEDVSSHVETHVTGRKLNPRPTLVTGTRRPRHHTAQVRLPRGRPGPEEVNVHQIRPPDRMKTPRKQLSFFASLLENYTKLIWHSGRIIYRCHEVPSREPSSTNVRTTTVPSLDSFYLILRFATFSSLLYTARKGGLFWDININLSFCFSCQISSLSHTVHTLWSLPCWVLWSGIWGVFQRVYS